MARTPQRGQQWSLRQVALTARVTLATARTVARSGLLDQRQLSALDALALRVAVAAAGFILHDEQRPANTARVVTDREVAAVQLIRQRGGELTSTSALVVTADGAQLLNTPAEQAGVLMSLATSGQQFLSLPVGAWSTDIFSALEVPA